MADQTNQTGTTDAATTSLMLIEEQAEAHIRRVQHDGRWYFSIIDVIGLLTDSPTPRRYWAELKRKLRDEGYTEVFAQSERLKMTAADGKLRETDAADTETMLRIIQSVPSPKAEPVKQWLAKVGAERLDAVTRPLDAVDAGTEISTLPKPALEAPALAWAEYHEQLAALYRRQAAYEAQLAYVDAKLVEHDAQIGELHSRMESLEEGQRLLAELPDLLERLGPQTLTPAHQRTVQQAVKRLHEVGGYAYATVYADLGEHFHVAKYTQITEDQWQSVAAWFKQRIEAAERRRRQ